MLEARRFVLRQMPKSAAALEGGTFTISAEMRAPGRGVRWRVVCRWREGESVEAALDRASQAWERLSKECR
jgi:hypothetical protein